MERKLWGLFSGAQLTIMFTAVMAVLLPGTLWAVDAYSNVAIENPSNGQKALIDNFRRLAVTDTFLEQSAIPANFTRTNSPTTVISAASCVKIATAPAGKALIITTILADTYYSSGAANSYISFYVGPGCAGYVAENHSQSIGVVQYSFQPGIAVPTGQSLWADSLGVSANVNMTGYLVPAGEVPASPVVLSANSAWPDNVKRISK